MSGNAIFKRSHLQTLIEEANYLLEAADYTDTGYAELREAVAAGKARLKVRRKYQVLEERPA